jgi:hypothetical protein
MQFILLAYPLLGAGIKYVDSAFDEKTFSKTHAIIIAPIIGVFWTLVMCINDISATILMAVMLGVFFKGKIDNIAHAIGLLSIIIFYASIVVFIDGTGVYPIPLLFLTAAGVLDEVGNDIITYNDNFPDKTQFRYSFFKYFFGRRHFMKVALIYLTFIGVFPLYFLVAFIFFDEAYIIVGLYSQSRKKRRA